MNLFTFTWFVYKCEHVDKYHNKHIMVDGLWVIGDETFVLGELLSVTTKQSEIIVTRNWFQVLCVSFSLLVCSVCLLLSSKCVRISEHKCYLPSF